MLSTERLGLGRGGQMIVSGLDLRVEAGWALQIHGANGSGKTTLLRVLAGLLPPAVGQVCWHGANVHAHPARLRRDLAFVGHANGVSDDLTVLENLRFASLLGADAHAAQVCGHGGEATRPPEQEVMAHAGLLPLQHQHVGLLSQGQRRRVALTRLVLERKPLWLLDEPADALDDGASGWLDECLGLHMREGGMVVTTTHRLLNTSPGVTRHLHLERSGAWLD
jgi:heme exporter protein A